MPILKNPHNIPAVPVTSQVLDGNGTITQEWSHFFRELADFKRDINDVEVLARRVWLPDSGMAGAGAGYGIVTFGLDTDTTGTNTPGKYGNVQFPGAPATASISCVTGPAMADAIFDVKFSHDNGSTWNSIFLSGSPFRFTSGSTGIVEFAGIFAAVTFAVGDLLRVDTIQSGGAQGITGVIKWQ